MGWGSATLAGLDVVTRIASWNLTGTEYGLVDLLVLAQ